MKVFKKPNLSNNWKCLVCGKNTEKEVVLIKIVGTEQGNNIEAAQFHLDCIDLYWDKERRFLYQFFNEKGK